MQIDPRRERGHHALRISELLLKDKKREKSFFLLCYVVSVSVVLCDQATKLLAKSNISSPISIFPGFNLVLVFNKGAAWGIFSGKGDMLLTFSALVLLLIVVFHRKLTEDWPERYFALSLLCAGIVGNGIDRICWKSVIDFLDFYVLQYHWPAFNVADSAICVGVGIFIISSLFRPTLIKPHGA